jgi:hypothetical protein
MSTRTRAVTLAIAALATEVVACGDGGKRPLGASCEQSSECATGLCVVGSCREPAADDDLDGLINQIEAELGSNPDDGDTDRDEIADAEEAGGGGAPIDTDGDGALDIVESAVSDMDADCVSDQATRSRWRRVSVASPACAATASRSCA